MWLGLHLPAMLVAAVVCSADLGEFAPPVTACLPCMRYQSTLCVSLHHLTYKHTTPPHRASQSLPKALGPKAKRHLEVLFDWALPACLRFVRRELEELSPSEDAGLARGAMRIIEACLDDFVPGEQQQHSSRTASVFWNVSPKMGVVCALSSCAGKYVPATRCCCCCCQLLQLQRVARRLNRQAPLLMRPPRPSSWRGCSCLRWCGALAQRVTVPAV